jgi:hypothetical protein
MKFFYLVISNNYSTVQLTFYGQSNQASIGVWNANQTSWHISSSICKINEQVCIEKEKFLF